MHSIEILKRATPWFVKIPGKIVLSRLPITRKQWQYINLFRAGAMDVPAQAYSIFKKHFDATGFTSLHDRTVLELGPGNSALTALFARSWGASQTWLVDAEELSTSETALFGRAEQLLAEIGLPVPGVGNLPSAGDVLTSLNAVYLTKGLESLSYIPDARVDFLFSNAVLEHVRLAHFASTAREMRRVLSSRGIASHQVDFKDHLQGGLNNLRFPERIWESEFMARSGFYTNRIPWPTMNRLFQEAGFSVEVRSSQSWPHGLPLRQTSMALPFRNLAEEELMTMGAHVVLRPKG